MNNKQHHCIEGIQKIVNLKASLNNGLSAELKTAFPSKIKNLFFFVKKKSAPPAEAGGD